MESCYCASIVKHQQVSSREKNVGSIRRSIKFTFRQFQLWNRKYLILAKGSINPYPEEIKWMEEL